MTKKIVELDYDNAINLVDVNRNLAQDLNFNYVFSENGFLLCHLHSGSDASYEAIFGGSLTTEKGEVILIPNGNSVRSANGDLTSLIPVSKGMKLHIGGVQCSKNDGNRILFLPLKK